MKVAVVGSRKGFDLLRVGEWIKRLWDKQGPTTTLISGGAAGVDACAESIWLALGGQVKSFRPHKITGPMEEDAYAIQIWELGGENPQIYIEPGGLEWADYAGACIYRDLLIAEESDRCVAFLHDHSPGTTITVGFFEAQGKPVHVYKTVVVAPDD